MAEAAAIAPLPKEWADEIVSILEADGVPGAAVSLIRPEGAAELMYGTADIATGAPVERTTGFQLCSLTKAYVATLACLLENQGVLSLDDPICPIVPEYTPEPAWLREEVRFRDLLSNRLGVSRGGFADYGLNSLFDYAELARRMSHMPRTGLFRGHYSYCNPGFSITALALERITGKSFAQLLHDHILGPAKLQQTLVGPAARTAKGRAWAHTINRNHCLVRVDDEEDWIRPGGGGILSTAADQQRWLLLNLGRGKLDGEQILPEKIWDQLWQPHIALKPEQRELSVGDPEAPFAAYALGWFVSTYAGQVVVSHTGGGIGWRARSVIVPDAGVALSILVNVDGKTAQAVQHRLLERCLGLPARPWPDIVRADLAKRRAAEMADLDQSHPPSSEASIEAARIEGRYVCKQSGIAEVSSRDGALHVRFIDGPVYDGALRPLGGASFAHEVSGAFATYNGPQAPLPRVRFDETGCAVTRLVHSYIGSFDRC